MPRIKTTNKRGGPNKISPNPISLEEVIISLSGAGDLLDVRFKVNEKMKTPGPVYIVDEETGKIGRVVQVPKIGNVLTRRQTVGDFAYGIFLNPEDVIKSGSLVTLVSGSYKKEHIKVT
jgi:hypothetical protein